MFLDAVAKFTLCVTILLCIWSHDNTNKFGLQRPPMRSQSAAVVWIQLLYSYVLQILKAHNEKSL